MTIRGFIFDLDGVIANTAEYRYRGWKRLAGEEGIPFTCEDNEHLRGIVRSHWWTCSLAPGNCSRKYVRRV